MKPLPEPYKNRFTLFAYYGLRALVFIAAAVFFLRGNAASGLETLLIFLSMLVPSILKRQYRLYLPFALDLGVVSFIFLSLFLGEIARFYDRVPFWDKFLHLQSGLLFGAIGYVLVYIMNEHQRFRIDLSPGFISLFAVTFSIAIGALWEIGEFAGDSIFGSYWAAGLPDTIWDLVADTAGACIVSVGGYIWMRRHNRIPFTSPQKQLQNNDPLI